MIFIVQKSNPVSVHFFKPATPFIAIAFLFFIPSFVRIKLNEFLLSILFHLTFSLPVAFV